jgi:hypothetical protein
MSLFASFAAIAAPFQRCSSPPTPPPATPPPRFLPSPPLLLPPPPHTRTHALADVSTECVGSHLLSLSLAFLLVVIGTRVGLFASFVEIGLGGRSLSDVVGDKPAVLTEALIQGGAKNCMHGSKTVMENMGGALTPGETASFSQECNPPPEVGGAGDGERARIVAECSLTLSTFDTDEDEELTYKEARGAREKLRVHVGRIPTARCTLPLDVRARLVR